MNHHPLDARSPPIPRKPHEAEIGEQHYILSSALLRGYPTVEDLLLGSPARTIPVYSAVGGLRLELTAVDIAAAWVAPARSPRERLPAAEAWARAHSQTAYERFSVGLALHCTHDMLTAALRRPELRAAFPTIDRCNKGWRWREATDYLTAEDTRLLRNSGWRDGAGRSIDRYLLDGMRRANGQNPLPIIPPHFTDLAKGELVDDRLPSHDSLYIQLIVTKGILLEEQCRAEILDVYHREQAKPDGRKAEEILALLDAERANRVAASVVSAPPSAAPGTDGSIVPGPEPESIAMTL